jgi:hypothetical protein
MNTPRKGRTKQATEIQFHSDSATGSNAHPAINVKYYGSYDSTYDDLTPDQTQQVWDSCVESFWEQAQEIAHEHGYSGVFSEGRSGGWLVPYFQLTADGKDKFYNWPGQGGKLGYPQFPDVEIKANRTRFIRFQKAIRKMLDYVPEMLASEARFIKECENEAN